MAFLVSDEGERYMLGYALNKYTPGDVKLHLYTNDYTPVEGSIVSSFTECTADGYGAITLTGANWTIATVSGVTTSSYAQQIFVLTGASSNYGYYITDNGGTHLLGAERFVPGDPVPHVFYSGGGNEKVTINIVGE